MSFFFDTHCHLQDIGDEEAIADAIKQSVKFNVKRMLCCGTSPSDWAQVAKIADKFEEITPAFGVHPWYAPQVAEQHNWHIQLRNLLEKYPMASLGEIGIDRSRHRRSDSIQSDIFVKQMQMAKELKRPVSLHCVHGWGILKDVLRQAGPMPAGIVLHSYSGSLETVLELAEIGVMFSFSSLNSNIKKTTLAAVPDELLLLESDAPYGLPGKVCDAIWKRPASLPLTAKIVADARGSDVDTISRLTTQNALRIFGTK